MPLDRNSDQYRIQRLEYQVIALQKNLLQATRLIHHMRALMEQPYNSNCQDCEIIQQCIKELEQITPYTKIVK